MKMESNEMVVKEINEKSSSIINYQIQPLFFFTLHIFTFSLRSCCGFPLTSFLMFTPHTPSTPNLHQNMSPKSSGHNPSLLLSLTKFARTHLRCISYFIFFSPYFLKLLSLLIHSPLLILLLLAAALCAFSATTHSTSLLLLGDKTEDNDSTGLLEAAAAYKIIFETFHDSVTDLADECDEVGAYKKMDNDALAPEIVKSCCSSTPVKDHPLVEKSPICDEAELPLCKDQSPSSAENPRNEKSSNNCDETEIIKHMVCSSTINKPGANRGEDDEEKKVKAGVGVEIDKAGSPLRSLKSGSNAAISDSQQSPNPTCPRKTALLKSRSCDLSTSLAAGSMRREKEWTRTLACKLFEERHNVGEDEMDMLWETYEEAESPGDGKADYDRRRTMSRRGSIRTLTMESDMFRVYADVEEEEEEEAEEDDDNDEVVASGAKMCCLQALKISSGKVNMGIGRKNMIKFSKALRGLGWFHKARNGKTIKNVTRK